jgi:hypothetical protein
MMTSDFMQPNKSLNVSQKPSKGTCMAVGDSAIDFILCACRAFSSENSEELLVGDGTLVFKGESY